jgi:hypothetical protein
MSRIILFYNQTHLVSRNNLQKEAREILWKYDLRVLPSEIEYKHMISLVELDLQQLNQKYHRCEPLKVSPRRDFRFGSDKPRTLAEWDIPLVGRITAYKENIDTWT